MSGAAIFHEECRQDPEFSDRVLGLERMLRVQALKESFLVPENAHPGAETVPVSAGKSKGIIEMHELSKSASIVVAGERRLWVWTLLRTTSVFWTMV